MTSRISRCCIVLLLALGHNVAVLGAANFHTDHSYQNQNGHSQQQPLEPTVSVRMSTSVVENVPASQLLLMAGNNRLYSGRAQRSSSVSGQPEVGRIGSLPMYRHLEAPISRHELTPVAGLRLPAQSSPFSPAPSLPRDPLVQPDVFGRRFGSPQQQPPMAVLQPVALEKQADTPRQLLQASEKCKRRNIFSLLRGAKNMLTGGFAKLERHATPGRIMFGSGLLASLVPIVALFIPDALGTQGNSLGSLKALEGPKLSLQRRVGSMMGWIERSVDSLPSFPTLHPQECIKRSVCEAHLMPDKYGVIGFVTRLLFPARSTNSIETARDVSPELGVINKYRIAADYGASRRSDNGTTNTSACREYYEECLISMLDVARHMTDFFLKAEQ